MKKYLILLLIIPIVIIGCAKKKAIVEYDESIREKILLSMGKTSDDLIVVKLSKSKNEQYYVYEINNINFNLYSYTYYNKKSEYDEALTKLKENYRNDLDRDDDALVTKVLIQKGSKSEDAKDLREAIINKYKDNKDYEIIE